MTTGKLDRRLFEQLFKEHFEQLCRFAARYTNDLDAGKDVVQQVFVNLWHKRTEIDPDKAIKSYLYSSVRNRCLNYIRDHKKYQSRVLDIETEDLDVTYENEDMETSELKDKIDKAVASLPPKIRRVFVLSRFEQKKYREIAEELDVSVKTVEAHISKALKILKEALKDYIHLLILLLLH